MDSSTQSNVGRRSWNLKFSYLSDDNATSPLFPPPYDDDNLLYNSGGGIFRYIGQDEAENDEEVGDSLYTIKDDFMSKVYHGSNGFMLPMLFQPDQNVEEYAIVRIDNDTASFNQVSNNFYDCSIDIVEIW